MIKKFSKNNWHTQPNPFPGHNMDIWETMKPEFISQGRRTRKCEVIN